MPSPGHCSHRQLAVDVIMAVRVSDPYTNYKMWLKAFTWKNEGESSRSIQVDLRANNPGCRISRMVQLLTHLSLTLTIVSANINLIYIYIFIIIFFTNYLIEVDLKLSCGFLFLAPWELMG